MWLDAQLAEFPHGMREALGFSPVRAMCFVRPCEVCMSPSSGLQTSKGNHGHGSEQIRGQI